MREHHSFAILKCFLAMAEFVIKESANKAWTRIREQYSDKIQKHRLDLVVRRFQDASKEIMASALRALREEAVIEAVRRGECSEEHAAELLDISDSQFNDLRCFSDIRPAGGDL